MIGVMTFGSHIGDNMMHSISNEGTHVITAHLMMFTFLIVLVCHMPYINFVGKESILILIDEYDRQSTSKMLQEKL